jgi:phospholipid-binding lipoprotein MlaA
MNAMNRITMTLAAAALAGCAVSQSKVDPYEEWNRHMYSIHETVDGAVIKPIAEAYVQNAPKLFQTGLSNFFGNIDDFFAGVNDALQGNGNRAGDAWGRVLLNTTFGIGGIFDLASMMGITKDKNDFGITFGKWGMPNGPYFFVPLFGPTTVRDGTGEVVRYFVSPSRYVNSTAIQNTWWGLWYLDARSQALLNESVLDTAAIDKYRFLRNAYLRARRYQLYDGKPPPEDEDE